ncbi:MAG: NAD(P)H-binding protein [Hamadaea sp.]|uniref:SDR family oxidoreductase n=1 Tax=Hamadaea sp. TaxID=2024425 RepID=UPI001825C362|nr:NAD(P)H-binding protein [Hamadaea sp.]NUT21845.1 NAD(P)H-binding protein [Hamadaea sp.]
MQKPTTIAVAGATGRVGRHVVQVLQERGHRVVPMSRSAGVDVVTGDGLREALEGVDVVIDVSSTPSPDQQTATEFFTAAAHHLHEAGQKAGVRRMVVVSIIGIDGSVAGYNAAKLAHERAALAGPIPTRILRAAQFHEFVEELVAWGTQGDVAYVPKMQTQLVAARAVAEKLVDVATARDPFVVTLPHPEIAGPRAETLAEAARLLAARRGFPSLVEEASDAANPDRELFESGGLLPGPHATLAGPAYAEWLDQTAR